MFTRIRYPDGQISAKMEITEDNPQILDETIKERINSYEDLFYLRSIADIIHGPAWKLFIPCMFGQRSDRRFGAFQSFDLKLIADIINDCKFFKVQIFDPHSDVTLALINNSFKVSSFDYVKKTVESIDLYRKDRDNPLVLISPDAGAYKKVFEYGEKLNLPVVAAVKHRDLDGGVDLTFMGDVKDKDCLIVDDLCDGGYTFEVLGRKLKEQGAQKVYLYVSHGLFSKGFDKLREVIDGIYCTNSIKDVVIFKEDNKSVVKIDDIKMPSFGSQEIDTFLTQFKII